MVSYNEIAYQCVTLTHKHGAYFKLLHENIFENLWYIMLHRILSERYITQMCYMGEGIFEIGHFCGIYGNPTISLVTIE